MTTSQLPAEKWFLPHYWITIFQQVKCSVEKMIFSNLHKVPYGSVVALHRGQEGKGSSFLLCVHTFALVCACTHTHTHSLTLSLRQAETKKRDKRTTGERRDRHRDFEMLVGLLHPGLDLEGGVHGGRKRNKVVGRQLRKAEGMTLTGEGKLLQTQGGPRWMGEWDDGVIFVFLGGGARDLYRSSLNFLEKTEHLSLGAKGDSGTGV